MLSFLHFCRFFSLRPTGEMNYWTPIQDDHSKFAIGKRPLEPCLERVCQVFLFAISLGAKSSHLLVQASQCSHLDLQSWRPFAAGRGMRRLEQEPVWVRVAVSSYFHVSSEWYRGHLESNSKSSHKSGIFPKSFVVKYDPKDLSHS